LACASGTCWATFSPSFEDKRVQINKRADAIRHAIGNPAYHSAAVRVAAQHDVGKFFPAYQVHDVENVCFQIHLTRQQMRAIGQTCQGRCKNIVALPL
jgi:hypothetical protein